MKKTVFLTLLCVLVAFGVQAQKPATKTTQPEAAQGKDKKEPQIFTGTIVYSVTYDDKEAALRKEKTPEVAVAPQSLNDPFKKNPNDKGGQASKKNEEEMPTAMAFFLKGGTCLMVSSYGMKIEQKTYPMACVKREDGIYICGEIESIDWPLVDNPKVMVYERVGRTKKLADVDVTLYHCKLPRLSGDIWVAEDYLLPADNAPFYGMKHPVLEFDFYIPIEDMQIGKAHLKAKLMSPGKIDMSVLEPIIAAERVDGATVMEQLLHRR